jgi:hypothetical protein
MLVVMLTACGSDRQDYPVQDQAGRQCVRGCQGSSCSLACQATPMPQGGCGSAGTACFNLAAFTPAGAGPTTLDQLGLCDGCCVATGGSFWAPSDCKPLVCKVDADCAAAHFRCGDAGLCEAHFCTTNADCSGNLQCSHGSCGF